MKITCVMVQTVNGKITEGDNPKVYRWTSKEDQKHFEQLVAKNNLIVMGSTTYEAAKKVIKPVEGKLRLVITRDPSKYEADTISGQVEFTSSSPEQLVAECESRGYSEMLLAGGGQINILFFNAGLVDELILTVEPKLFGEGKGIVEGNLQSVDLELIASEKLNDTGTLLLHYSVKKS